MRPRFPLDGCTTEIGCYLVGTGDPSAPADPITVVHGAGCTAIADHDWTVPPVHTAPCGCQRLDGFEHFVEHRPHSCGAIPAALTVALLEAVDSDTPAPEVIADLEALARWRRSVHPELYVDDGLPDV